MGLRLCSSGRGVGTVPCAGLLLGTRCVQHGAHSTQHCCYNEAIAAQRVAQTEQGAQTRAGGMLAAVCCALWVWPQ